jgi:hypothetical protein
VTLAAPDGREQERKVQHLAKASVGLVFGLAIAGACSDRDKLEEEPDRVKLCGAHCAQIFGPCNPAMPSTNPDRPKTEEECNSNCVADVAWEGACRFKYGEKMTCSTDLSCEEFKVHQTDVFDDPCFDAESEWASCFGGDQ